MKKILIIAAACLFGLFSACSSDDPGDDPAISLAGTTWECIYDWEFKSVTYTDRYVMNLTTETEGNMSYFPDERTGEEKETYDISYIFNYPQIKLETVVEGETAVEEGTVSADYKTIAFEEMTFNRK